MRVSVGQYSQPDALVDALREAGIRHDQRAWVDFARIQVTPRGELRFCPMAVLPNPVLVHDTRGDGNDEALPRIVTIQGHLNAPGPGIYRLANIVVYLNSSTQLHPTIATRFERVPARVLAWG